MNTFKRTLRLLALMLMIAVASIISVPMNFSRKGDLPKFPIEQLDTQEEENEEDDIKEIF